MIADPFAFRFAWYECSTRVLETFALRQTLVMSIDCIPSLDIH